MMLKKIGVIVGLSFLLFVHTGVSCATEPEELPESQIRREVMETAPVVDEYFQKARTDLIEAMNEAAASGNLVPGDQQATQKAMAGIVKKILDDSQKIREKLTEPEHRLKLDAGMLSLITHGGDTDQAVPIINHWKGEVREMLIAQAGQEFQMAKIEFSPKFDSLLVELAASKNLQLAALGIRLTDPFFRNPVGKPFPEFPVNMKTLDGEPLTLERFNGKILLVDFWATWCPPCVQTIPGLVAAYTKFKDKGLEIVGISFDQDKDSLNAFVKEHGITWPLYFDGLGWENKIGQTYGIQSIPTMFLLDRTGKVITDDLHGDKLNAHLETLLGQ